MVNNSWMETVTSLLMEKAVCRNVWHSFPNSFAGAKRDSWKEEKQNW